MEKVNERYFPEEEKITRHGFITHMEKYMKELLEKPISAKPDEYLDKYGIDYKKAQEMLLTPLDKSDPESAVMRKEKKIITGNDGKDKFSVKYLLPRKDYNRKMRKLFINSFEKNIISELNLNEDGDGATNCSSSGQFTTPLGSKPIKRTIYMTEDQMETLKEATAGDIGQGYTVPLGDANNPFYSEAMDHNNNFKKSRK